MKSDISHLINLLCTPTLIRNPETQTTSVIKINKENITQSVVEFLMPCWTDTQ